MTNFGHQTVLISTYSAVWNWLGISFFDNIQSASYSKIVVWLFEACITVLESKWRTNETDFQCDFSWLKNNSQKVAIFLEFLRFSKKCWDFLDIFKKLLGSAKKLIIFEFSKISQKYHNIFVDSQEISICVRYFC